jgi:flavin-dependent dehydrogenase
MSSERIYDAAIIGGGLAGLSVSILLARQGFQVFYLRKSRIRSKRFAGNISAWKVGIFFLMSLGCLLQK